MTEDSLLSFDFPAGQRKTVTADFTGGSISLDFALSLLAEDRHGCHSAAQRVTSE